MTTLADWIEYGMTGEHYRNKAMFRRWLREARERRPVRDWVNFPECGYERRLSWRG
jgi:hypothetical protein